MTTVKTETGSEVNLEELRRQLTSRMALLLAVFSSLLTWLSLIWRPFPIFTFGFLVALLCLGWRVWTWADERPVLARHLLVWGLTVSLLSGMGVFSASWLPFLGPITILISAMLVSGSELVAGTSVIALAAALTYSGARVYSMTGLLVVHILGVVVAIVMVRILYTALAWSWTMQIRADQLLELARDRQADLSRALRSLDLSNVLLQRTQRELISARLHEEKARLMKEQFAANVSHELRTPLNIITGFSEVMYLSSEVYGDLAWPASLRRDVYQIYRNSRHLMELINDVLDLSRFEMVEFTLHKEPTLLKPLLEDAVQIAGDLFRNHAVSLEVAISDDLPVLQVDRTRMRQVLLNLLNNAARFTEQGTVRVEAKRVNGEVVTIVSDTGPGIPEDELPHIFEEFYQIDRSLHRRHGGAGLGLAICQRFVKAHEGRIWATSVEGAGSTFCFSLPIQGHYVPASPPYLRSPAKLPESASRPPILVIDPDPSVGTLIGRHIEACEVVQIKDVHRLDENVMLWHPHAIVHNTLPGVQEGPEVSISASVPVIECSLPSQTWVANDLAVVACLIKPIDSDRLLREIDRLDGVRDVLVIDDNRDFCRLIERMLETSGRGFRIRMAYDGLAGLQAMQDDPPDLVLLDLTMPGMDGLQMLEQVRQDPRLAEVPVILLTVTSLVEDAMLQRNSQIVIRRAGGLRPSEVLRCLQAVVGALEPRYDERSAPEAALV